MSKPTTRKNLIAFWKTEARQWRKLFEKQRGGAAFDAIQAELVAERIRTTRIETALRDVLSCYDDARPQVLITGERVEAWKQALV